MIRRNLSDLRLAAFIMTYERPEIIVTSIRSIRNQSIRPQKILIVDNSVTLRTEKVIEQLNFPDVFYHRMGHNTGPAGAAKYGLMELAKEEFDWIYWGDDDDPPNGEDTFERLLSMVLDLPKAGAIGSIGGYLHPIKGVTRNLANHELQSINEVDYVPGNKDFIINGEVVRKAILPSAELFFGFEELDYCLKIKKAGYKIYIDGATILKGRLTAGNTDPNYRWRSKHWGIEAPGLRQYYSARNMLFVLLKNQLLFALTYVFIKTFFKAFWGYRYGVAYGKKSFTMYSFALYDFLTNRKGSRNFA